MVDLIIVIIIGILCGVINLYYQINKGLYKNPKKEYEKSSFGKWFVRRFILLFLLSIIAMMFSYFKINSDLSLISQYKQYARILCIILLLLSIYLFILGYSNYLKWIKIGNLNDLALKHGSKNDRKVRSQQLLISGIIMGLYSVIVYFIFFYIILS